MDEVADGQDGVDNSVAQQQIEQLNSDLEFSKKKPKEKETIEEENGDTGAG